MATTKRPTATRVAEQIPRPDASPTSAPTPLTAYSSESGRTYRLDTLIGKGGFGEVYLAAPTPQDGLPDRVCIKVTIRLSGWLR